MTTGSSEETKYRGKRGMKGKGKREHPNSHCEGGGRKGGVAKIIEEPVDKNDQYKTLMGLNGQKCEIVTGVTIVYPIAAAPGYELRSIAVSTLVEFKNNSPESIKAYVETGEGMGHSGGLSTRGLGGFLVKSVQGDYDNVVGFPTSAFWRWMTKLHKKGVFSH